MQRRGNIGGALNVLRSPRPLFDIGVIAKSSMGSLARHPRCASLMLGMRVTKRRPLRTHRVDGNRKRRFAGENSGEHWRTRGAMTRKAFGQ
jgi:hypothetical protein